jgi:Leucine-rich repeat (LRR) protein
MQLLGLVGFVIAIVLGVMFVMNNDTLTPAETTTSVSEGTGLPIINDAKLAAKQIEQGSGAKVVVYDGISVFANEVSLDLSGRGLTGSLKGEIRHVLGLVSLDISDNKFTGLPAEIGQLTALEELDLSNNPLTGLPHELGNLAELKQLDLRGTNYSEADLAIIKSKLPADTKILVD